MCLECRWENWLEKIESLIRSGRKRWAFDTLDGIRLTIERHDHITSHQIQAVKNIAGRR